MYVVFRLAGCTGSSLRLTRKQEDAMADAKEMDGPSSRKWMARPSKVVGCKVARSSFGSRASVWIQGIVEKKYRNRQSNRGEKV